MVVLNLTGDEADIVAQAVDCQMDAPPSEQRIVVESLARKIDIAKMVAVDAKMVAVDALMGEGQPDASLEPVGGRTFRVAQLAFVSGFLFGVVAGLVVAAAAVFS